MANSSDLVARVLTLRNQVNDVVCFNEAQRADKEYDLETLDQVIATITPIGDEDVVGDYILGDITHINGLAP